MTAPTMNNNAAFFISDAVYNSEDSYSIVSNSVSVNGVSGVNPRKCVSIKARPPTDETCD